MSRAREALAECAVATEAMALEVAVDEAVVAKEVVVDEAVVTEKVVVNEAVVAKVVAPHPDQVLLSPGSPGDSEEEFFRMFE
ncbi:hypothetical protein GUJ93_ZPchr0014g47340 [Zizania palustris]|uniref:Uncharacterized protein n=1 Tax=Zizania palustris TaxID=103762 RepID=A0A8J5THY0_ZIZPA|nr:hypothetical protein GUJ93_ZPchr0014g47340 [Zizania palustris]